MGARPGEHGERGAADEERHQLLEGRGRRHEEQRGAGEPADDGGDAEPAQVRRLTAQLGREPRVEPTPAKVMPTVFVTLAATGESPTASRAGS